jgi:hypothetical protein
VDTSFQRNKDIYRLTRHQPTSSGRPSQGKDYRMASRLALYPRRSLPTSAVCLSQVLGITSTDMVSWDRPFLLFQVRLRRHSASLKARWLPTTAPDGITLSDLTNNFLRLVSLLEVYLGDLSFH